MSPNPEVFPADYFGVATAFRDRYTGHQFIVMAPTKRALMDILTERCGYQLVDIDPSKFRFTKIVENYTVT